MQETVIDLIGKRKTEHTAEDLVGVLDTAFVVFDVDIGRKGEQKDVQKIQHREPQHRAEKEVHSATAFRGFLQKGIEAEVEAGQYGKVLKSFMSGCPSLSKVQDNDAGACPWYCYHCPGWVLPIMSKVGYYYVYDLISLDMPRCQTTICEHIEDARAQLKLVLKRHKGDRTLVRWNFPEED